MRVNEAAAFNTNVSKFPKNFMVTSEGKWCIISQNITDSKSALKTDLQQLQSDNLAKSVAQDFNKNAFFKIYAGWPNKFGQECRSQKTRVDVIYHSIIILSKEVTFLISISLLVNLRLLFLGGKATKRFSCKSSQGPYEELIIQ